jgi:hypothetical protein
MTAEPKTPGAPDLAPRQLPRSVPARPGGRSTAGQFNWGRFWVRALLAMLAFNVLAAILTVYVIFPWLHPAR